jgi:hypothetical protein
MITQADLHGSSSVVRTGKATCMPGAPAVAVTVSFVVVVLPVMSEAVTPAVALGALSEMV